MIENLNFEKPEKERLTPDHGDENAIPVLLEAAAQEGYPIQEVGLWGHGEIQVHDGEAGIISTEALNGCFVSIITANLPSGDKSVVMTHFPPNMALGRFQDALNEIRTAMATEGASPDRIITLVASDRLPTQEVALLEDNFPGIHSLNHSYKARSSQRRASLDAGHCAVVLDRRHRNEEVLHVATDSGDLVFDVSSSD